MLKYHYMYLKNKSSLQIKYYYIIHKWKKEIIQYRDKLNKSTGQQNLYCILGASIFSSALYWKKYDHLGLWINNNLLLESNREKSNIAIVQLEKSTGYKSLFLNFNMIWADYTLKKIWISRSINLKLIITYFDFIGNKSSTWISSMIVFTFRFIHIQLPNHDKLVDNQI